MSRYFTSPPPVYARNWANGQNLVESTKIIERQVVPSNKVHRKEKKEKKHKNVKSIKQLYLPIKKVCDESEQLERSCLTEEHHHVGYLSDGSQNSKKRRREASPVHAADDVQSNTKATPVVGKPLRIRFVFKKPKETEVVVPQEAPVCSTSGTDRSLETSGFVTGCEENLPSSSFESEKISVPSESKKKKKHKISRESRYSSLFDEPVLPILMEDSNSDDWLLGSRWQENAPLAKSFMNEDVVCNVQKTGDSCFPSPKFLPEVEIFSLPYTVLF